MNSCRLLRAARTAALCAVVGAVASAQSPAPAQSTPSAQTPSSNRPAGPSASDAATSAEIRKAVDDAIRDRLRDSKVVELETSQAIATRLSEWAKLFGFFIGIPLALFAGWLGVVGFKSYKDVKAVIDRASAEVARTFDDARESANKAADVVSKTVEEVRDIRANLQEEAQKLRTRLQEVAALIPQVQELSQRVASIENVVKFKASKTLTPELKQHLTETLQGYYQYLKAVGLSLKLRQPTVVIDSKDLNAYYLPPPKNEIVAHPELIEHPDVALREFTHHVLGEIKPEFNWSEDVTGIESGLADYLPSSFMNESHFGKAIWPVFERHHPGLKVPNRDLKNQRQFSEIVISDTNQQGNGNVWGGAWWELRETLGRETVDKLLIAAWRSFRFADSAHDLSVFPLELIAQDRATNAGKHGQEIRRVFERRRLPFSRET
jgi:F0F1-type ATP synthase membrane subunit b/b'